MNARTKTCLLVTWSVLAACGDERPILAPRIVTPPPDSAAYPYNGADALVLSIARAGDPSDLQQALFAMDDDLALPETPFGSDLVVHMSTLASGVEISYGRTCAVDMLAPGTETDSEMSEPALYLSRIVRWGPGGWPISGHRINALAYSLGDGSALFLGGEITGGSEHYDPLRDEYTTLDVALMARTGAVLAVMDNSRALIVGGRDESGALVGELEILDPNPALGRDLQLQRAAGVAVDEHIAATLVDNTVLVAGGWHREQPGQSEAVTDQAWLLALGDGDVLEPPQPLPARMLAARAGHSATRLGDELGADVLVVGGRDDAGQALAASELYRPLREAFEPLASAQLAQPRWRHQAVRMPGGFVLILGGVRAGAGGDEPVLDLELYDPGQGQFGSAGRLPVAAGVIDQSVTPLPDGRVLLAGGRDASGQPVANAFIARLDPIDGQVDVVPTDSLALARAGHSAVRLCDGTVLVVGGAEGSFAERYNPPSANRR